MILYRIYTELSTPKHLDNIYLSMMIERIPGYTLIHTEGYWKGAAEKSCIIEILSDRPKEDIHALARRIQKHNNQQEVIITAQTVDTTVITRGI